jgi:ribonucleoside-diphosphate reductase alpha chain
MIEVVKRNGQREPLDLDKFHKVVSHACEGLSGVSASQVELASQIQFKSGIKTSEVQEILIQAAGQLITEETPNYQYVAGRLINYDLRKQVYGQYEPPTLFEHYTRIASKDYYDHDLMHKYSEDVWSALNEHIDHERDDLLTYAAMEQFRGKYLIRNRDTNQFYETPQMAFMLISMVLFQNEENEKVRLKLVKDFYDAISTFDISLPSPIMAGVRSPDRQFSSCVLIESGDSLDSISATAAAIVKYVSRRAGIGIGAGAIRAAESPVRGGKVKHTGVRPFYRHFSSAVDSCSQGSLRKGSATLNYVGWHREFEDLVVLKNNKGTEDTRIKNLDYCVQLNRVFYERLLTGGDITFFSPSDVPGLYEAFFSDTEKFRELYERAERNTRVLKASMPAKEFFEILLQERKDTGRIYISNVDHVNSHGSFTVPVKMTNLCVEITLPTQPLNDINDENGEIALCTLAALNFGKATSPNWFKKPAMLLVRALNNLLDYQHYPIMAAQIATLNRRPLGIGVTNFAYWLAKNGMTYTNPDYAKVHEYAEGMAYWLTKASIDIAKARGACKKLDETKYGQGILPIDTYKKEVDSITAPEYKQDWEELRTDLDEFGLLNSTLMAGMPCETSSATTNSTNGFEPIAALITTKISKDLNVKQVVPEIRRLKNQYELKWDMPNNTGYLNILAIFQKFFDQAISVNTYYNPQQFPGEEVPMSVMLTDLVKFYQLGGKNLYYCNTFDGAGEYESEEDCESCKV